LRRKFLGKSDIEIALILEDRLANAHIQANDYKRMAEEAIQTAREANNALDRVKAGYEEAIARVKEMGGPKS
jgi:GrpB-like predicted nucleotidyltransferase (UPF0157 family)